MMQGVPSMRERIDAGELVLCMALAQARTADIPMIAAAAGFDAVYVDLEHTAISLETTVVAVRRRDRRRHHAAGARARARPPVPHPLPRRGRDGRDRAARRDPRRGRGDRRRLPLPAARAPVGVRAQPGQPLPADARSRSCSTLFDAQTVVAVMLETPARSRGPTRSRRCRGARHGDARPARPHRGDGHPRAVPRRDVPRRGAHRGEGVSRPRQGSSASPASATSSSSPSSSASACASSARAPTSAS